MNTAHNIVTDVMLQEWYQLHYEKSLTKYGPDSIITRGYKDMLERISRADVGEKTLQVHYSSDHSRPLDTSYWSTLPGSSRSGMLGNCILQSCLPRRGTGWPSVAEHRDVREQPRVRPCTSRDPAGLLFLDGVSAVLPPTGRPVCHAIP